MSLLPTLNWMDAAAVAVILLGALRGMWKGLSSELARMICIAVAFVLGAWFYRPCGLWCAAHTRLDGTGACLFAFALITIAALVVLLVIAVFLGKIMKVTVEPGAERIGGAVAGTISATLLVVAVFAALNMLPRDSATRRKAGRESLVGRIVVRWMPSLRETIGESKTKADELGDRWNVPGRS